MKKAADLEVPNITAQAINHYLADNSLDEHIARLNKEYAVWMRDN
ncbi:hypothetical protein [Secundilactobacillus yichangensis]|nr:hypothetical protein [Secundilactobacillus yichangensis]